MIPLLATALVFGVDFTVVPGAATGSGDTEQWAWGVGASVPSDVPAAWGTNLDDRYLNDATDVLDIALGSTDGLARPVVHLRHQYDIRAGDLGTLWVLGNTGWRPVSPIYGYPPGDGFVGTSDGWEDVFVDLTGIEGASTLRLQLESDLALAGDGWFLRELRLYDGDPVPPRITPTVVPIDTQDLDGPYVIEAVVDDDVEVERVTMFWREEGGDEVAAQLSAPVDGVFRFTVPGQDPDTRIGWRLEASDGEQTTPWPPTGEATFRVFLAAPLDPSVEVDGRPVAQSVELRWLPPDSPHPVSAYVVASLADLHGDILVSEPAATVPVFPHGADAWEVRAVFGDDLGDPSVPVVADVEVPRLTEITPAVVFQGERRWLSLAGSGLYLHGGTSSLEVDGLAVEALDVLDAHSARARVQVMDDATPGPRQVRLVGAQGSFVFSDAFTIAAGDAAPRILSVEPSTLMQGRTATLQVVASQAFAAHVTVDPGPSVLLTSDVLVERERATFEIAASADAAAGVHTLVLDDGERLWTVDLVIERYRAQNPTSCAHGLPGGWVFLGLLLLRRRQAGPDA